MKILFVAAGHDFFDRPGTGVVCACGRRWVDIRTYGSAEIGQPDIAHTGQLNAAEAASIAARRAIEDENYKLATVGCAAEGAGR